MDRKVACTLLPQQFVASLKMAVAVFPAPVQPEDAFAKQTSVDASYKPAMCGMKQISSCDFPVVTE